jgi:hypothetical protein
MNNIPTPKVSRRKTNKTNAARTDSTLDVSSLDASSLEALQRVCVVLSFGSMTTGAGTPIKKENTTKRTKPIEKCLEYDRELNHRPGQSQFLGLMQNTLVSV